VKRKGVKVPKEEEYVYVDERGQPSYPQSSYTPIPMQRSDKADLIEKIKPDAIVETIRHKLMGEELVNEHWHKVNYLQKLALTGLGAWNIANLMLSASSQNVSLSKLNDQEIKRRTLSIIKTAQFMLLRNWKSFGIKSIDQLAFVNEIVLSNTFITLKQPEHEGIRRLIMGTTSDSTIHSSQEEKRRRWWPFSKIV
jgi:hypothetical protein